MLLAFEKTKIEIFEIDLKAESPQTLVHHLFEQVFFEQLWK